MCVNLKEANILNDETLDLRKHSEQRYFLLICTVQRSRHSANFEKECIYELIEDRNIKIKIALGPKSEVLSSKSLERKMNLHTELEYSLL